MPDKLRAIKSRAEVLALNDCFASHLIGVQKAKHQPSDEWTEGDSLYLDDSDVITILTENQAIDLNKEDQRFYIDNKDDFEPKKDYQFISQSTMISPANSSISYMNDLQQIFLKLSEVLGELLILGDWNTPWLSQENEYPPVKVARDYFSELIDKNFDGGFCLKGADITEFIPHLFWLTRCNMSLPSFMITFGSSNTIFNICKYGVVHMEFYNAVEQKEILTLFNALGFKSVDTCSDPVEFDNMEGRALIV